MYLFVISRYRETFQGWYNRPKAVQIKDEVVNDNIRQWADRLAKHRSDKVNMESARDVMNLPSPRKSNKPNVLSVHPSVEEDYNVANVSNSPFTMSDNNDYQPTSNSRINTFSRPSTQAQRSRPSTTNNIDGVSSSKGSWLQDAKVLGKPYSTPGPKYNLRADPQNNRLSSKYVLSKTR
jgi:hypothetical protein